MEKVSVLSALWRVCKGNGQNNTEIPELDEITGVNPELIEKLKKAKNIAETRAENRFKDELYKKARSNSHHKTNSVEITRSKQTTETRNRKKGKDDQMTIG